MPSLLRADRTVHIRHLSVTDFRGYAAAELALTPGTSTIVGLNGQGKTNLVEAIGYLASLTSHRVATDQPLVRFGAERAVIRGVVDRAGHETLIELELTPGRANRAKLNRAPLRRAREVLGALRTVLFAPEDLALVKGEPSQRRAFVDALLVSRQPRWAAVQAEYDRVLRQRNALLRSAAPVLRRGAGPARGSEGQPADSRASALDTLGVWDAQLSEVGAQLLYARLRVLHDLGPFLSDAYDEVSGSPSDARIHYRSSLREVAAAQIRDGEVPEAEELRAEMLATFGEVRSREVERGVSLVGPHRDDVVLTLGALPARGYASHGESWSFALGLKLAAYQLLRHDLGEDPVLMLDDVFAELDSGRRERLATLIGDCEQVLITAAVPEDVPSSLVGTAYAVSAGEVRRVT